MALEGVEGIYQREYTPGVYHYPTRVPREFPSTPSKAIWVNLFVAWETPVKLLSHFAS